MNVAATTQLVVRLLAYNEPTTATRRSLVSTSANDTAAGTGARKVRIVYLDGYLDGPFSEDVILTGTTPVNTVADDIRFIESLTVTEAGSSGANGGTISLMTGLTGAGTVIGQILFYLGGFISSSWAHHYTPRGVISHIGAISAGMALGPASTLALRTSRRLSDPTNVTLASWRLSAASPSFSFYPAPAIQVVGPARIDLVIAPDAATSGTIYAGFTWNDV